MKKHSILFVVTLLCIVACRQTTISELTAPQVENEKKTIESQSESILSVTKQDECLVFENVEHLEQVVSELLKMTEQERVAWYEQMDFTSLQNLYDSANDEINSMISYSQYENIQEKYKKSFLFNKNDKQDLPPYYRIENLMYACVLNGAGEVICEGEKVCYNKIVSVEQTNQYMRSQSVSSKTLFIGNLYINDGTRKLWVDSYRMNYREIWIRFGCQVLSFWGWNVFRQSYFIYYNRTYTIAGSPTIYVPLGWSETGVINDGDMMHVYDSDRGSIVQFDIYAGDMGPEQTNTLQIVY